MENNNTEILVSIDSKVDQVKDKLHSIEIVQTRIESDLKYHIKRTDLLEDQVVSINKKVEEFDFIKFVITKNFKVISIVAGSILTILTILKLLRS
jgi:hypothetical protein